jgi:hypothetical protein
VPGGFLNCAGGEYSFAAGVGAKVRQPSGSSLCTGGDSGDSDGDEGTFVWADKGGSFISTGPNQFLVRASGGVGINTNNPSAVSLYVKGFDSTAGTVIFQSPKAGVTNLSHVHYGANADCSSVRA